MDPRKEVKKVVRSKKEQIKLNTEKHSFTAAGNLLSFLKLILPSSYLYFIR
jgi:hypothetical protein